VALANQLQSQGAAQQPQLVQQQAQAATSANQALNQLAIRVKDSTDLVDSLKAVR
jgi:hypothetical protein